ncbi:hypothetical protein LWI29_037160 [Acer saccharum]|uniref:Uncharacterized protein n=1 Tax=Acer saccharum TaxID=4024 RepID=A0AA39RMD1_ACESA|nr:hypothetical protein LWI29_034369 [Acer saccharum]KAK0575320.1 hypothetical protein LWI29_037160 [Acer saccharum]
MYQQQYYYPATPFVLDSFIEPDTASNNNMSCFTTTDHDQLANFYSSFPDPDPDHETYDLHHQEIPFQIHESTTTKPPLHHKTCTTDEYHHPTSSSTMVVHELGSSSNTHPVEKKTCIQDFEQLQPPVLESSSVQLLHQEQSSNIVTFHDNCNLLWGGTNEDGGQKQELVNQYGGLHNLHSF